MEPPCIIDIFRSLQHIESSDRFRSFLVLGGQNPLLITPIHDYGFIHGTAADVEALLVVCESLFFGNELQGVQTHKDYITP
jgi:hypothetical protein